MAVEYYFAVEERTPELTARLTEVREDKTTPDQTRLMNPFYLVGTRAATSRVPTSMGEVQQFASGGLGQTFTLGVQPSFLEKLDRDIKLSAPGDSRGDIGTIGDLLTYLSSGIQVDVQPF